jgi:hypothetical protein
MSAVYVKHCLYSVTFCAVSGIVEMLPAGEHSFLFNMMLPNILPSSFEGQYGYVRYTVTATLDRSRKFDHEVKATFTVLLHLDLNQDPVYRVSIAYVSQFS